MSEDYAAKPKCDHCGREYYQHIEHCGMRMCPVSAFAYRPALTRPSRVDVLSRDQIKALWKEHGGSWHGPIVEHYSIEEQAFYRFIAALKDAGESNG